MRRTIFTSFLLITTSTVVAFLPFSSRRCTSTTAERGPLHSSFYYSAYPLSQSNTLSSHSNDPYVSRSEYERIQSQLSQQTYVAVELLQQVALLSKERTSLQRKLANLEQDYSDQVISLADQVEELQQQRRSLASSAHVMLFGGEAHMSEEAFLPSKDALLAQLQVEKSYLRSLFHWITGALSNGISRKNSKLRPQKRKRETDLIVTIEESSSNPADYNLFQD